MFSRLTMTHMNPKTQYEPAAHTETSSVDKLKGKEMREMMSENLDNRRSMQEE